MTVLRLRIKAQPVNIGTINIVAWKTQKQFWHKPLICKPFKTTVVNRCQMKTVVSATHEYFFYLKCFVTIFGCLLTFEWSEFLYLKSVQLMEVVALSEPSTLLIHSNIRAIDLLKRTWWGVLKTKLLHLSQSCGYCNYWVLPSLREAKAQA